MLPLNKAAELFELYSCHVNARKGTKHDSIEARAYRKLLELEEAILLWEELQVSNDGSELGNDRTVLVLKKCSAECSAKHKVSQKIKKSPGQKNS